MLVIVLSFLSIVFFAIKLQNHGQIYHDLAIYLAQKLFFKIRNNFSSFSRFECDQPKLHLLRHAVDKQAVQRVLRKSKAYDRQQIGAGVQLAV